MKTCIIACRTLEKELLAAMKNTGCTSPVFWLPAGEHNVPHRRRAQIQQMLDACCDYDTVLLAMSLCGNSVTGVVSPGPRVVVPRCDDCITVLLGSERMRKQYPAAYFLTEGWLKGKGNLWAEYCRAEERYGKETADRIFSAMLANYWQLAFVDSGCADVSAEVRSIARKLNLEYIRIPGTLSYLEELLTGPWDDRFLILPPKSHSITVLPQNLTIPAAPGSYLLDALTSAGIITHAPCGGMGRCGKCRVVVDGKEVLACRTPVTRDLAVTLPPQEKLQILHDGIPSGVPMNPLRPGYLLAFDIGTTSVVCHLTDGRTGSVLASAGAPNPQSSCGADVISRIRAALSGHGDMLTRLIRDCMEGLVETVCRQAQISPAQIGVVSVVGNPAMQQLFLGISPENLATIPFSPALTEATVLPCGAYLPSCQNAALLVVPDISGFVGADTVGCILATRIHESEDITLLVDIGTNGELVLGNKDRLIACATAAGPALEGACIRFGMSGTEGAIDHVWLDGGEVCCSVIGNGKAKGICSSGLVDAVAVMLELGLLNRRGRILTEDHIFRLAEEIYLTQEDIRQIQLAKGAIQAGIRLMVKEAGVSMADIQRVLLAGAFGTHLNCENACRIGLLPKELADRITPVGNAALTGARVMACNADLWRSTETLAEKCGFLELASLPDFPKTFARAMGFEESSC